MVIFKQGDVKSISYESDVTSPIPGLPFKINVETVGDGVSLIVQHREWFEIIYDDGSSLDVFNRQIRCVKYEKGYLEINKSKSE